MVDAVVVVVVVEAVAEETKLIQPFLLLKKLYVHIAERRTRKNFSVT